jgi:hypothetical protein
MWRGMTLTLCSDLGFEGYIPVFEAVWEGFPWIACVGIFFCPFFHVSLHNLYILFLVYASR